MTTTNKLFLWQLEVSRARNGNECRKISINCCFWIICALTRSCVRWDTDEFVFAIKLSFFVGNEEKISQSCKKTQTKHCFSTYSIFFIYLVHFQYLYFTECWNVIKRSTRRNSVMCRFIRRLFWQCIVKVQNSSKLLFAVKEIFWFSFAIRLYLVLINCCVHQNHLNRPVICFHADLSRSVH